MNRKVAQRNSQLLKAAQVKIQILKCLLVLSIGIGYALVMKVQADARANDETNQVAILVLGMLCDDLISLQDQLDFAKTEAEINFETQQSLQAAQEARTLSYAETTVTKVESFGDFLLVTLIARDSRWKGLEEEHVLSFSFQHPAFNYLNNRRDKTPFVINLGASTEPYNSLLRRGLEPPEPEDYLFVQEVAAKEEREFRQLLKDVKSSHPS